MQFMPIDVNTTEPQSGGFTVPEGFYLLQIEDATQTQTEKDGVTMKQVYKTRIVMGPGWSPEYAGKVYNDKIRNTPEWAGRHMELACAALGSKEAVRSVANQHGGHLPAEVLHGRMYIAQLNVNGSWNNVIVRLPYTQEAWNENAGPQQQQQLAVPQTPMAPPQMPQMAPPQMPPAAPQYAAPQGYPPPQMAAPQGYPQMAAPPAMYAPPQAAPAPPAPPAPPPPPGMPAAR
jgi:hypothetical protein